jgi:flagellar basal body-associated protein FliL
MKLLWIIFLILIAVFLMGLAGAFTTPPQKDAYGEVVQQ